MADESSGESAQWTSEKAEATPDDRTGGEVFLTGLFHGCIRERGRLIAILGSSGARGQDALGLVAARTGGIEVIQVVRTSFLLWYGMFHLPSAMAFVFSVLCEGELLEANVKEVACF